MVNSYSKQGKKQKCSYRLCLFPCLVAGLPCKCASRHFCVKSIHSSPNMTVMRALQMLAEHHAGKLVSAMVTKYTNKNEFILTILK